MSQLTLHKLKKLSWYFLLLCAGIIILFWKLDDTVGLHRDEAIFGLFAEMILNGALPVFGVFNDYTAPLHTYLLAICIKFLGNSIWSLRFLGPIFTLLTIAAIYDTVRAFSPVRATWISCLLITFPPIIMLSRLCGEVFVLNPFLFFGTIWIFVRLCQNQTKYKHTTGLIIIGFLTSLGIWNHAIFLPSAASLIVCYTIFLWPGIRQYFINGVLYSLGFLVGLSPRFVSALFFENNLFPKRPPIPRATLKSALLNFLYTLSGDSLYARFSGKSAIPFVWETTGIILTTLATFYFFKRNKYEKKIFWGIYTFFVCNFIGVWLITPFGSIGSRLWLIPAWIFPISLVIWMPNLREWKWRVTSGILLVTHVILLLVNHYIPNNNTHGVISPSVYVGGKYDNTWDYYDHRQITNKLAQADSNLIFISTINVFTFYYLMPPEQRHKIKLLWQAIQYSTNPEKQKLYDSITYKGPIPHSALFVFYENDKDYLETFYNLSLFKETILDEKAGIPGFKVFRFK